MLLVLGIEPEIRSKPEQTTESQKILFENFKSNKNVFLGSTHFKSLTIYTQCNSNSYSKLKKII